MTTREQVLQQLDHLATVEHSLCVEYLSIHCALGHDLPPVPGPTGGRVADAAAAFRLAVREMSHLLQVNGVLTLAGRRAQLSRAASIGPVTTPELERLLDRERQIGRAVDQAYDRVCEAFSAQEGLFEDELQGAVTFLLDPCPDHSSRLDDLKEHLEGIPHGEFLRAAPRDPRNAVEGELLDLSDMHYGLIVATVRAWVGHEAELGGDLRGRAISAMDNLNVINGLLVQRGLLPRFALPVNA